MDHLERALAIARHARDEEARADGEALQHAAAEVEPARAELGAVVAGEGDLEDAPAAAERDARA